MTVDDFLYVMARNAVLYPEFAALPEAHRRQIAKINIMTGTAESFYDDSGKLFMVGGIRFLGIGDAWMITNPENRTPLLLRTASHEYKRVCDDKGLWRVFAETRLSNNFLKHLKFEKQEIFVWTR